MLGLVLVLLAGLWSTTALFVLFIRLNSSASYNCGWRASFSD